MISLKLNEEHQSNKLTELTDHDDQENTAHKEDQSQDVIHRKFSVVHVGSLDAENFFSSNPGMLDALKEIESVRKRVKEKGGIGVAILLVRCGPIVQVCLPPEPISEHALLMMYSTGETGFPGRLAFSSRSRCGSTSNKLAGDFRSGYRGWCTLEAPQLRACFMSVHFPDVL